MIAQFENETTPSWQEGPQRPTSMKHVTLFILLAVYRINRLIDLSPVVESKAFWAPDLDAAQEHARTMLQADGHIDHVSILDGQGHGVLGVTTRSTTSHWPPAASMPPQAATRRAFH